MRLLFLDFDGVLNRAGTKGFQSLDPECVKNLCLILDEYSDLQIVVTSAWRCVMERRDISCMGMEFVLFLAGASPGAIHNRIIGWTEPDHITYAKVEQRMGEDGFQEFLSKGIRDVRGMQILNYLQRKYGIENYPKFAVLDDLDLHPLKNFVQTDNTRGLTAENARAVIELLR